MNRQIVIIVPVIVPNDAISNSARRTCELIDALEGMSCRILTLERGVDDPRTRQISGVVSLLNDPWFLDADVLIYDYGLYNPLFQAMILGNGRARQVVRFHNVTPEAFVAPRERELIRKSFRQIHLFSNVDEIWADSSTNIDMLELHGVRTSHASVIPLIVDTAKRTSLPDTPPDLPHILFLGRFVQSKGILDLLKALTKVKGAGQVQFRLTLAGNHRYSDPGYLDQVHSAAALLGNTVDFRGEVTDMERDELFRAADIFAIPSYHEGFCVPVIEALAAGCIPVGYDNHNLPNIFNGFGRLVRTGDIDALAKTLEEVCFMLTRPDTPRVFELDSGRMTNKDHDLALTEYLETFTEQNVRVLVARSLSQLMSQGPFQSGVKPAQVERIANPVEPRGTDRMDASPTSRPVRVMLPVDSSDIRDEVEVLPDNVMRQVERLSLNRLPDFCDWEPGNRQTDILREIGQPVCIHRKPWEYSLAITGLEQLGVVTENAQALAIGAGSEPPIYYYANKITRMVATDLYDNPDHEGRPAILENPAAFAPFPYRENHLEVLSMPGDALAFPDESFDFAFCLSSIEHFGSREAQRRSIVETARVLKPGGIYCCITELILTRGHTHQEYFTFEEIEDMFFNEDRFELVGGKPDFRISKSLLDYPTTIPSRHLSRSPHIVLEQEGMKWTSFSMFLRKT